MLINATQARNDRELRRARFKTVCYPVLNHAGSADNDVTPDAVPAAFHSLALGLDRMGFVDRYRYQHKDSGR